MATRERGKRRTVVGTVVSDAMHKTIAVREDRLVKHAKYGKTMRLHTVHKAHDEKNDAKVGDQVEITPSRPLSKTKRWRLVKILKRGRIVAVRGDEDREAAAPPPPRRPAPAPRADEATAPPEAGPTPESSS
jgi:small subunit ribosomal protein S17